MTISTRICRRHLAMLLSGAALWTLPAHAQSADGAQQEEAQDTGGVQDIVVTAQRRDQQLQDVPISISAITGELAERRGITDTTSVQTAVVGLDLSKQVNAQTPFLRGVGTPAGTVGNEPSVATYIDDVYIPSAQASVFNFNNIERVEVLRGPQGTLFGRNATGGVINIITRDPGNNVVLRGNVGYANYDTISGAFYGSTPLSDNVAIDLAAAGERQGDGWGRNITTGQEVYRGWDYGFRSKLRFDVGTNTRLILSGDYNRARSETGINLIIAPGTIGADGVSTFQGFFSPQGQGEGGDGVDRSIIRRWGLGARLTHDFERVTFRSITSYRRYDVDFDLDQDATPANLANNAIIDQRGRAFSQEFQLLSANDSAFDWILGLYYFKDRSQYDPLALGRNIPEEIFSVRLGTTRTESAAAFAQGTYEFAPDARFTAGLRYTSDLKGVSGVFFDGAGVEVPGSRGDQEQRFNRLTWRLALDYRFSPDVMAYMSYNRGFKSGQFNIFGSTLPAVNPEIIDAYEIGLRTDLLGRTLRFNVTGFYYDYQDIQVTQVVFGGNTLSNAGRARIYGAEVEIVAAPSRYLTFSTGVSYLNGRYTEFENGPTTVFRPAACDIDPVAPGNQPGELPGPRTGGLLTCGADLSGRETVRTPEFTITAAIDWRIPTSAGDFDLNANIYHNSGYFWEPDNSLRQPSYTLVNTSLQWNAPSERYYVRVWARNLFNEIYAIYQARTSLAESFSPASPRTYGLTVGFNFR